MDGHRSSDDREKTFKELTGPVPQTIFKYLTPLHARDWKMEVMLYADKCANLDHLKYKMQRILLTRFIEESLYREIKLSN